MRRLLPVIAILILTASIISLWLLLRRPELRRAFNAREVATRRLGEYLAQTFPGKHVLVVSNPFTKRHGMANEIVEMEKAGISGLQKAFGTESVRTDFPELRPEAQSDPRAVPIDSATTTPLSYLVAENAFDKLLAQHPDCEIIVSLIGLPVSLDRVRCWQPDERAKFALLLPDLGIVGDSAAVQKAVQSGKLVAFVLNKPGAPETNSASGDFHAEFDERFLLVTAANIDEMLRKYPQLFPGN